MQLLERLQYHIQKILEYNISDPKTWTLISQIYFDEYEGDSTTCEIHGRMRTPFLDSLRNEVGGSAGERREKSLQGGIGIYKSKDSWEEFKTVCKNKLFPKGFGCTIQILSPRDITIYEGNHRIRAAAEMGLYDMPVHLKFYRNSERYIKNVFSMDKIINRLKELGVVRENSAGYLHSNLNGNHVINIKPSTSNKILR